jgi:hypothetical protein
MAIFSIHPQFLMELCCHCLDGTKLHQNDKACCAVRKLISNQRVMPTAPTPAVTTKCPAHSKQPTQSKTRNKNHYGPQKAILSPQPEPINGSCSQHGVYLKCHDNVAVNDKCLSLNINPPSSRQQKQVRCQYPSATPLEWPVLHHSERAKPCQAGTVI